MRHKTRGFTLVELNLALIFVGMLVIGVAAVVINITKINQRGIMLKTINQTGREVVDQMRRDIGGARADRVQYEFAGGTGRLCLGTVSYVFNTAEALHSGGSVVKDDTKPGQPAVVLVRMDDKESKWCERSGAVFTKNSVTALDEAVELLQSDEHTLPVAIHKMEVQPLASTADKTRAEGLVSLSIELGTNEAGTLEAAGSGQITCKPPTDHQANFDNCAVREFRTVVRSNGQQRGN